MKLKNIHLWQRASECSTIYRTEAQGPSLSSRPTKRLDLSDPCNLRTRAPARTHTHRRTSIALWCIYASRYVSVGGRAHIPDHAQCSCECAYASASERASERVSKTARSLWFRKMAFVRMVEAYDWKII